MNIRDQIAEVVTDFENNALAIRIDYDDLGQGPYVMWHKYDYALANTSLAKLNILLGSSLSLLSEDEILLMRRLRNAQEDFQRAVLSYPMSHDHYATQEAVAYRDLVRTISDELLLILRARICTEEFPDIAPEELAVTLPEDVEALTVYAWREARIGYANECYMSAIAMCGRLIETYLNALFRNAFQSDAEKEDYGINAMLNRLRKAGYPFKGGVDDVLSVIAVHRNKAVHAAVTFATRDQARGILSLTKDLLTTKKR